MSHEYRSLEGVQVSHPDCIWAGGEWQPAQSGRALEIVCPNREEIVAVVAEAGEADMDVAVAAARDAFDHGPWPRMSGAERYQYLARMIDHLRGREVELARAWTGQMGGLASLAPHIVAGGTAQLIECVEVGAEFEFVQKRETAAAGAAYVAYDPIGVAAAITPWNRAYGSMAVKMGSALMAGCTVVMKPSPETPLEAYILAEAGEAAGLPPGVLNMVCGDRAASDHLVCNPGVDKVSFTGSTVAGRRIASVCGDRVARTLLELGGKSAAILCDDFPTEDAAKIMTSAITLMSGQVCATLSRLIVPRHRQDEIAAAIAREMESMIIGHSDDPASQLGPLAMKRQLERVEGYIAEGRRVADLVTGGNRPSHLERGYFIQPTLFANVDRSSRIAQEEIFGPVLCIIPVDDEADAIAAANDSIYGLSGAVLTRDARKAFDIARQVRTGNIGQGGLKVDSTLPYGGVRQSGLGRKGGVDGLLSYLETKTILLDEAV